jgi:hypothetical protein
VSNQRRDSTGGLGLGPTDAETTSTTCVACDQVGGIIALFPGGHPIHLGCAPKRWRNGVLARDAFMARVRDWALLGGASDR